MRKSHRQNLEKLATYLEALPVDYEAFEMAYFNSEESEKPVAMACGAVACAVGHGINAGIPAKTSDYTWLDYAKRTFGVKLDRHVAFGSLWSWCFSSNWQYTDNTAQGAALRIRAYLADTIPNWFEAERQITNEIGFSLKYRDWKKQCTTSA